MASLKHRVILTVCYARGLRISEAVHLTPASIDRPRQPGGKDYPPYPGARL